jgi:hypothetical protein
MMTRIFGVLMIIGCAFTSQAQSSGRHELAYAKTSINDPKADNGVSIYPTVVTTELNIAIDAKLAGGSVVVSVFNNMGEIVLENVLGIGLNKVDASVLPKGNYVAVVRQNDDFRSKSNFEVK